MLLGRNNEKKGKMRVEFKLNGIELEEEYFCRVKLEWNLIERQFICFSLIREQLERQIIIR